MSRNKESAEERLGLARIWGRTLLWCGSLLAVLWTLISWGVAARLIPDQSTADYIQLGLMLAALWLLVRTAVYTLDRLLPKLAGAGLVTAGLGTVTFGFLLYQGLSWLLLQLFPLLDYTSLPWYSWWMIGGSGVLFAILAALRLRLGKKKSAKFIEAGLLILAVLVFYYLSR